MKTAEILLVEDNHGDAVLLAKALRESGWRHRLNHARDGAEALSILRDDARVPRDPLPDVIVLDLNIPVFDGRQLLTEIRTDPGLRHIPVMILTSSRADGDIVSTHGLHDNAYVVKPFSYPAYAGVVDQIRAFCRRKEGQVGQ